MRSPATMGSFAAYVAAACVSVGFCSVASADIAILSSTAGIHGGDNVVNGIHGGDSALRGIHGGDNALRGIHGGDSQLFDSIAMGPVESIVMTDAGYELTVVGQRFQTEENLDSTFVGDYVVAAGVGDTLAIIFPIQSTYIPGASPIAVRGQIGSVDSSMATLSVGGLVLDYSAVLSVDSEFSPAGGQTVEFSGFQPAIGGLALLSMSEDLFGIHGGDSALRGIHGGDSALRGIHGGDSALRGIHGGDSALRGIHGGDSALRGIHGGDNALRGIHGGDNALRGIHGGDSALRGIHGGDSALRGIHGGDSALRGIHGGDSALRGIHGGDLK
jgi:hypothetical protein